MFLSEEPSNPKDRLPIVVHLRLYPRQQDTRFLTGIANLIVLRWRVMLNFMATPPYLIKIESAFKKIDELIQKAREDTGTTGYQALVEAVQALSQELRELEHKTEGTHPDTR